MEFFLFAGLIALDIVFFVFLAIRYTYVEDGKKEEEGNLKSPSQATTNGTDNEAFTADTQI